MEQRNLKQFEAGERSRRNHSIFSSAMEFIYTTSGSSRYKWDLLFVFMIYSGLLIFTDGYTALQVPEENQLHYQDSSSASDLDLLKQAQEMCRLNSKGTFQVAPCIWCECTPEGNTKCWAQSCPQEDDPECIKYKKLDGDCCPTCVQYGCRYNGTSYQRGETILTPDLCKKCYCPWNGESRGKPACVDSHCPPVNCVDSHIPPGKCCPVCSSGPNCWLKEHKLIIPTGRKVWVDKCHVCYCPSNSKSETNKADVLLATFIKQSNTMARMEQLTNVKDTQHAVCAYEKSYACDEDK